MEIISTSSSSSSSSSSSFETTDSSSEEENLAVLGAVTRLRRVFRVATHPFDEYDESEFHMRFRLKKQTVMSLLQQIGHNFEPITNRNQSISSINQLLVTLRFLATGAYQILLGDDMHIHKSTTCRIISKVIPQIAALHNAYIVMPQNTVEVAELKNSFHEIAGFPSVVGCIDCTHVRIRSPGGENAEQYRNRKGYFSYNVQAVCDANLRIINIDARWPGSTHDSSIFRASSLHLRFTQGEFTNSFLLADSAYQQKKFILTPFLHPQNIAEERYNRAHIRTRNCIERCFGVLKRRFPGLSMGFRTKKETTLASIVACAVLHNMAIKEMENVPPQEAETDYDDPVPTENLPDNQGNAIRAALVHTAFM